MQHDYSLFNDTREDGDFEAIWEVATSITSDGWNAEFRIPFSQIRFTVPDGAQSVWGFQVRRDIQQTSEADLWNAAPRGTQGFVSRFGHLFALPFGQFPMFHSRRIAGRRGASRWATTTRSSANPTRRRSSARQS
ncbi:MAG TPA: hypothetical protein VFO48_07490 [Vicinamibacterales bacterium]|nr:hypothetical protein [Vicinamibacterales bacterium]